MTGSGLAAQLSQSLEIIAWGTRRSVGQFIPQYRTNGQYGIEQSAKTLRPTIMSAIPAEAVERVENAPAMVIRADPRHPSACSRHLNADFV